MLNVTDLDNGHELADAKLHAQTVHSFSLVHVRSNSVPFLCSKARTKTFFLPRVSGSERRCFTLGANASSPRRFSEHTPQHVALAFACAG